MTNKVQFERPRYQLGGVPARRWMTWGRFILLGICTMALIVLLVMVVLTRNNWLLAGFIATAAISWFVYNRRTITGGRWVRDTVSARLRRAAARMGRWDEFDPAVDERPWPLEDYAMLAVTASEDDDPDAGLCLIDTGRTNCYVAVIEVDGDGQGIRPNWEHDQLERGFHGFLDHLTIANSRVAQVDLITKISPEGGEPFMEWTAQHLRPGQQEVVQESMIELARGSEHLSSQVRSWAVVVMPMDRLVTYLKDLGLEPNPELIAEAAAESVSEVTRSMIDHGLRIHQGLSTRQISAVIRGIMLPDYNVDDISDIEDFWAAFPGYQPTARQNSLIAYSEDRDNLWYHRSCVVPRDGFPTEYLVNGRWLEPIVLESAVPHRVISVKYALMPHHQAREIARDQLTSAAGRVYRKHKVGTISDGEVEEGQTLAQRVASNVRRQGNGGVIPVVRVLVSAKSERMVARYKEQMEAEMMQKMGISNVIWDIPALGMMATLPLGVEVERA